MRKDEIAFEIAEFIKAGPQAAEAQGVDKSTYDRLLLCLADEETLEIARRLAGIRISFFPHFARFCKWLTLSRLSGISVA